LDLYRPTPDRKECSVDGPAKRGEFRVRVERAAAASALQKLGLLPGESLLRFAEAVVVQLTSPPRSDRTKDEAAGKIARVLSDATTSNLSSAVDALLSDPPLLAAFFQNSDLLDTGEPEGAAVADSVMGALAEVWDVAP
jgi:hypothetical protein